MIDIATRGIVAAPSPGPASDPVVDSGPAFATLLMQTLAREGEGDRDRAVSMPAPAAPSPPMSMVEPPVEMTNMPLSAPEPVHEAEQRDQPIVDRRDVGFRNRPVIDHAVRFDARGVLNMTAMEAGAIVGARSSGAAFPMGVVAGRATEPPCPVEASLPARTLVLPGTADVDAPTTSVAGVAPRTRSSPPAPPVAAEPAIPSSLPDEPEVAPVVRPRPRTSGTMARGAPQVAVAALADGLAVVAAVGALSDTDRHRLRDAIAATVARHGYHPRAVTLLAMPAPARFPES